MFSDSTLQDGHANSKISIRNKPIMITLLRLIALALLTILWHFLFAFNWWQSLFLGWLSLMLMASPIAVLMDTKKIKNHLGIDDDE
jgi:hypothetical protein